jgi:hypothetical protein
MPEFLRRPWRRPRWRRKDPFSRVANGDLDILMPPPYDMSPDEQLIAQVEMLLQGLQPGAIDAGSRHVLGNLINSWAHQALARLDAERDERQAVGDVLVGLAQEELASSRPRYEADYARVLHAYEAVAVTYAALTGKKAADLRIYLPPRAAPGPLQSGLGPAELTHPWVEAPGRYPPWGVPGGLPAPGTGAPNGHDPAAGNGHGPAAAPDGDGERS